MSSQFQGQSVNCELSLLLVSSIYETFCIVMHQIALCKTNTFQITRHLKCSQHGCCRNRTFWDMTSCLSVNNILSDVSKQRRKLFT